MQGQTLQEERGPAGGRVVFQCVPRLFSAQELAACLVCKRTHVYAGGHGSEERRIVIGHLAVHLREGRTAQDQHGARIPQDGVPDVADQRRERRVLPAYPVEVIDDDHDLLRPPPAHQRPERAVPVGIGGRRRIIEELSGSAPEIREVPGCRFLPGREIEGVGVPGREICEERGLPGVPPAGDRYQRRPLGTELVLQDQHLLPPSDKSFGHDGPPGPRFI